MDKPSDQTKCVPPRAEPAGVTGQFNASAVCDVCGRFGAFEIGAQHLCTDCYEAKGSCCPEFGADDLWVIAEDRDGR